jgi:class 3 adenylate cyclase/tetratricopeptide (TPR) repeat protein
MLARKTVTVLFSDVDESIGLGERHDAESLRRAMFRYFDMASAVLEHHGGTVEKFVGDAIMAVFGIPTIHEDDALRAVRAAAELQARIGELNLELERNLGIRLALQIGVDTGEVVVGDPRDGRTLATGNAINVAARLQQAAGPGQILIGKTTHALVKDAVETGPLESFPIKGKSKDVERRRLHEVKPGAPGLARRLDAPLVGRGDEVELLLSAFEQVERERSCRLFTILGPAGIGKSRLAAELVQLLGDRAAAYTGRCLAYGEGITFWPLAQIVREIGDGPALADAVAGDEDAGLIVERVRGAIGAAGPTGGAEETFWAVRRLFECLAAERPLVLCFEDIHWAEPTFLDLIEYLGGWSRGAPIFLLCLARPDLVEQLPGWIAPKPYADALALEPLSGTDSLELLAGLGGHEELSEEATRRITDAAEGNPLFVEQMVAMAAEGQNGELAVPPSIQALLAERLDRLTAEQRAVIERASVVGREFPRVAIVELCPPEMRPSVGQHLMELVRKELIRPDPSAAAREDGFGFRHILIRDAAYDGLAKKLRANLHERFADWTEAHAGERATELEEIVGYHLEQAYRYREQLGPVDESALAIARRGAEHLAAAARRALARGDMPAAATLLTRATILLREDDEGRVALAPDLGAALIATGEMARAEGILTRAIGEAQRSGDRVAESHARLRHAELRLETDPLGADEAAREVQEALLTLEEIGDDLGVAAALHDLALVESTHGRHARAERILGEALERVEPAGAPRQRARILLALGHSLYAGPTAVEAAIEQCRRIVDENEGDKTVQGGTAAFLAVLHAMAGDFPAAHEHAARSKAVFAQLGAAMWLAHAHWYAALVCVIAGETAAAEDDARTACEMLERAGARAGISAPAAMVAEALLLQGNLQEADRYARLAEETAPAADVEAHVAWRRARAQLLEERGELKAADKLLREAVAIADETDSLNLQGGALEAHAGVLVGSGNAREAADLLERAAAIYDAKGNSARSREVRKTLARLVPGEALRPQP